MKKRILFLALIVLGAVNLSIGQAYTQSITSITIESDTVYAPVVFDNYYTGSKYSDGVVGFTFTVADTISNVTLEGGYEGLTTTQYVVISNSDTLTTGNYSIYDSNPEFQEYRLGGYGLSGDTATLSNIMYFDKEVK